MEQALYKEKLGLLSVVRDKIRPMFLDLSDENLLSKCLHGKTQNSNESINNGIWKRCPKDIIVGRKTLEFGVASAIISFNDGISGVLNVFKKLNIPYGTYTTKLYNLFWERSLQTRLNLGVKNFMQRKRILLMQMKKRRALPMRQCYCR